MPVVSMFYGVIVYMYFMDNRRHKSPHIHVEYQGDEAVFDIQSGEILEGAIALPKARLVQAWIEIHREDLMADWNLATRGQTLFRIDPLR